MAAGTDLDDDGEPTGHELVYVTPEAQQRLVPSDVRYHFGGWSEDYDSHETQQWRFQGELENFWDGASRPDERLWRRILQGVADLEPGWEAVSLTADGHVAVRLVTARNGSWRRGRRPRKRYGSP